MICVELINEVALVLAQHHLCRKTLQPKRLDQANNIYLITHAFDTQAVLFPARSLTFRTGHEAAEAGQQVAAAERTVVVVVAFATLQLVFDAELVALFRVVGVLSHFAVHGIKTLEH